MVASLALSAAAEGGGGGLTDIDSGLFIWTLVMFAVFAGLLAKFAWGPLLKIIDEREQGLRDAVQDARKSNEEAASLLEEHRAMLRDAGKEREEILKTAQADADRIKADITEKARSESESLVKRAREQIDREKTQAIGELRTQVADIAIEAASKIVRASMSRDEQKRLVDDFIAELPKTQ